MSLFLIRSSVASLLALACAALPGGIAAAEAVTPEQPVSGGWMTSRGELSSLHSGFHTEEGDYCSLSLQPAAAMVVTGNGVWSGFDCPWPRGSRHFPIDDALRSAVVAALSPVDALLPAPPPEPEQEPIGYLEERAVLTSQGGFVPSFEALPAIEKAAVALVERWIARDASDGLESLIVTWEDAGLAHRVTGEKHGVLHESRWRDGVPASDKLRALSVAERTRLLELLAALTSTESLPTGAEREVFVRFGDRPISVTEPLPKPIVELLEFLRQ